MALYKFAVTIKVLKQWHLLEDCVQLTYKRFPDEFYRSESVQMWENNRFVKISGRSVNMEFLYDIDMLEMIRWPSMEDTPDLFEAVASSYQGLGPYDGLFPFPRIVPCHNASSVRSPLPAEDSLKSDSYSNRSDCDDTLMVTSNDALRFEEDCLFESPSPSCINDPHQSVSGAESSANRFLCQKNSMADMTLAQLNDSNASDTNHKVDLAELKIEVNDLDRNFDSLSENFSPASKPANSLSTKEQVVSRLLPPKQSNAGQQPLFVVKDEHEGHNVVKRDIKTEQVSPVKCSLKTPKALKRGLTSSVVALSEGDNNGEPDNNDGLKTTAYQGHEAASVSSNCWPVGKKIKLEITGRLLLLLL